MTKESKIHFDLSQGLAKPMMAMDATGQLNDDDRSGQPRRNRKTSDKKEEQTSLTETIKETAQQIKDALLSI